MPFMTGYTVMKAAGTQYEQPLRLPTAQVRKRSSTSQIVIRSCKELLLPVEQRHARLPKLGVTLAYALAPALQCRGQCCGLQ